MGVSIATTPTANGNLAVVIGTILWLCTITLLLTAVHCTCDVRGATTAVRCAKTETSHECSDGRDNDGDGKYDVSTCISPPCSFSPSRLQLTLALF